MFRDQEGPDLKEKLFKLFGEQIEANFRERKVRKLFQ